MELLPVCRNFEILHNAVNINSFVKVFLAPSDMNNLIFGLKLDIVELYRVRDFQICRAATSRFLKYEIFHKAVKLKFFVKVFLGPSNVVLFSYIQNKTSI